MHSCLYTLEVSQVVIRKLELLRLIRRQYSFNFKESVQLLILLFVYTQQSISYLFFV